MIPTRGLAAFDATGPLGPWEFTRRPLGPRDIQIAIDWCGICHSDLHTVRGEWGAIQYPQVPGHEIVGRVVAMGGEVTGFAAGDRVGVGCLVDSCRVCDPCRRGLEPYCEGGSTDTYGAVEKQTGRPTQGGYAGTIVVDRDFVLRVPPGLDPAGVAPLLCAGITTWSPLRHWQVTAGQRVGIVGLGGLGHMGVKLAAALGAEVTVFTRSPHKTDDARRLGAQDVILSEDRQAMRAVRSRLDLILDTVSDPHALDPLLQTLRLDGTLVLLGGSPQPHPSPGVFSFITKRRSLAGSLIGGLPETQEMLDFCGAHGLTADVEVIAPDGVNAAYDRMLRADVRYRFVIDCASLQ